MELLNGYKTPVIVNGELLKTNKNLADSPLWVYFDFVKPGKHYFCVNDG